MRITKLELHGFKSFPDRTLFHFGPGISCVVGPNGCGKSNVVDALKWCIGEQSARSLRGAEMSDVIFAGSADRRAVGFAEVQLTLVADDADPFPGAYAHLSEVQVGRRLHRTGTSEYLINQVRTRRRDVVDLLLDTGIGNDLYAFIEQGQVDKMVAASSAERRTLIDEAAGIARYKSKRHEAMSRLEATAQQLDRVADVLDEMGRRLKILERQALRAARFRRLSARIRQRELLLGLVKFKELAADRRALREALHAERATEGGVRRELARRENDLVERREEAALVDAAVTAQRDQVAEHDARQRELRSVVELSTRRRDELAQQRAHVETDIAASVVAHADRRREAEASTLALASSQAEVERHRAASTTAHTEAEAHDARAVAAAGEAEAAEARWMELQAALVSLRGDSERLTSALAAAPARTADVVARRRASVARLHEAEVELEARRQAESQRRAQLERAEALHATARSWAEAARSAEADAEAELRRLQQAHEARSVDRARHLVASRERGARWVAAAERADDDALEAHRRAGEAESAARRVAARDALDAARAAASAEAERVVAEVVARSEVALQRATSARDRCRSELAALDDAIRQADRECAERAEALALIRAEHHALARRVAEGEGALARLREVDPQGSTALDAVPDDQRGQAAQQLGDRVLLPWVREASIAHALLTGLDDESHLRVVVWTDPLDRLQRVAAGDLADAFAAAPGTEVVGDGFRLRADGVLELGRVDSAVRERERLGALDAELAAAVRALDAARGAADGHRIRRDEVAAELGEAETACEDQRIAARQAVAEARREAEVQVAERLKVLRAEHDARAGTLDRALRERLAQATLVRQRQREERTAAFERALDALRSGAADEAPPRGDGRDAVRSRRRQVDEAVAELAVALAATRADAHAATVTREASEQHLERTRLQVQREQAELEQVEREAGEHAQELDRLRARLDLTTDEERSAATARQAARALALEAATLARSAAEARSASSARLTASEAAVQAASEAVAAAAQRATEAAERHARLVQQAAELVAAAEQADQARADADAELQRLAEQRAEAWDRLETERERSARCKAGLAQAEEALRGLVARREEVNGRVQQLAEQSRQTQSHVEVLRQRLSDRYQVSLPALLDQLHTRGRLVLAPDDGVREGLQLGTGVVEGVQPEVVTPATLGDEDRVVAAVDEVEADREALAKLGEVHLGALEEYGELSTRHDELGAQRDDLEESMRSIRSAIAKMNRTCRERFREAFDRVNEEFQGSYPQLVGGGTARLSLTDDEDLLETGVDIFVQPPGKRLQHLTLLSGGEKAMTAIALLIALFRVKPSPFCVLDEVDAPLDEANGARFNEMLREMSRTSQFVVITHNRKTMECADTLYGVTMARPGVSRLVSVTL